MSRLDEGDDEQNEGLAMSFRKHEDLLVFDGIAALATGKTSRDVFQGFNGSRIPHRCARLLLQSSALCSTLVPLIFPRSSVVLSQIRTLSLELK